MKVVIVGSACVGKSVWRASLLEAHHPAKISKAPISSNPSLTSKGMLEKYHPSVGGDVHPLVVDGKRYHLWEVSGSKSGFREGYFVGADAIVVMVKDKNSMIEGQSLAKEALRVAGGIPVVFISFWNVPGAMHVELGDASPLAELH